MKGIYMTNEKLTEIAARCEKATPGSWAVNPGEDYVAAGCWPIGMSICKCSHREDDKQQADLEFIAHARNDIPALLDHVRELREALTEGLNVLVDGEWGTPAHAKWDRRAKKLLR
jgi:hypothetical protein